MTVIKQEDFIQSIADAFQFISYYHPVDYIQALTQAWEKEENPAAKDAMAQILVNSRMCAEGHRPICQDTGIATVFLKVGMNVQWESSMSVQEMVNEGVRRAYTDPDNTLRASVLADPAGVECAYAAVKASFDLSSGVPRLAVRQAGFLAGDVHWGDPAATSLHAAADLTHLKPATDVLLLGRAVAAGGPVEAMDVSLRVGDPTDPTTQVGALISQQHWEKVSGYIRLGIEEGATLLAGGPDKPADLPAHLRGGNFLRPTVLADVDNRMRVAQEEIFGPVACLLPFKDEAEGLRLANDIEYGLASYIWTQDISKVLRLARGIEAGMVFVNTQNVRDLRQLSMGQKKKVFMSVALAAGTEWLLMDEPTNGLDIPSKATFRQVVAKNLSDDTTLIISTHQVHDVEQLIDHVVILDQSRLLCDASVGEITQRYSFETRQANEMTNEVLYAEPSLQGNNVIVPHAANEPETQLNLEMFFSAVTLGKIQM